MAQVTQQAEGAEEAKRAEVGESKAAIFGGAGGIARDFGESETGDATVRKEFEQRGVDAQNATITDWQAIFSKTEEGGDPQANFHNQMDMFKSTVEGQALSYVEDAQSKLEDPSGGFANAFNTRWEKVGGVWQEYVEDVIDGGGMSTGAGAFLGFKAGAMVGGYFGPVGAIVGGFVGALAGGFAAAKDATHCCTAAEKHHGMSKMKVAKLRVWHRKQPQIWQEGYDIWGKIIADNLVAKYKWWGDSTERFYDWFIKGKKTWHGAIAIATIFPGSYIVGSYIVAKKRFKKGLERVYV
jgi:hypothetical protein